MAASPRDALKVFDVNLRPPFVDREVIESSLRLANLLKLNDQELPVFAEMFGLRGSVHDQVAEVAGRFNLTTVVLTRGERGSFLWTESGWSDHPGLSVDVSDTVGAGDAFTAALTVGLLAGWGLEAINQRANEVAAYVCTKPGGMPELPEHLAHLALIASGGMAPWISLPLTWTTSAWSKLLPPRRRSPGRFSSARSLPRWAVCSSASTRR